MQDYSLPIADRKRLRNLAEEQGRIASLPINLARQQAWTAINDGKQNARPVIALESETFSGDFMPDQLFECSSNYGKLIECNLLRNIRHHEIIGDDHVCPNLYPIPWHIKTDEFGIEIKMSFAKDDEGSIQGYHFECPIHDLDEDGFEMIKPASFEVDREETFAERDFLQDLFGDYLPVRIEWPNPGENCLTQRLIRLMSMEAFFMAMYDCPDKLHALMRLLCDNAIRKARWGEAEGLLRHNHTYQISCGTCANWTTRLPKMDQAPGSITLDNLCTVMDSQETVGISPELFNEFIFPYYSEIAQMYGQVYWGCCEPADPIWESSLQHLPNLHAVSIARWTDQAFMADVLAGKGIVYSRKPNPNLLGVSADFHADAWRAEIRSTLDVVAPKNVPTEFVVRDVYSLHGNLAKLREAVIIAQEEFDRVYGPRKS